MIKKVKVQNIKNLMKNKTEQLIFCYECIDHPNQGVSQQLLLFNDFLKIIFNIIYFYVIYLFYDLSNYVIYFVLKVTVDNFLFE